MDGIDTRAEGQRRHFRAPAIATAIVVALLLSLLFWRSSRSQAQAAPPPPAAVPVAALAVSSADLPVTLKAIGSLRAVRHVTLTAEVPGRVVGIAFASGATVRRGQLIAQLNDLPERASQRSFGVSARLAAIRLSRARELVSLGAEAQEVADGHRAERDRATAEIGRIDATIAQKRIRAPFAGTLGIRRANLGQFLNPGDPIATLTDLGQMYVEFQVPQKHAAQLATGSTVVVTTDGWPGRRFVGRIDAVEPQISEDSRNLLVQALIDNADGALRPGMYVEARLDIGARRAALTVPASAIVSSAAGESVVVVDKPDKAGVGTATFVPVKTGDRLGDDVVVIEGLVAGKQVVTAGQLRLRPGLPVRIAPSPARPARSAGGAR